MMATTMESTQAIPELLRRLSDTTPVSRRVLTAYVDTSSMRSDRQAYVLALRDGCKRIRASLGEEERDRFERSVRQTEAYVVGTDRRGPPGLAVFASGGDDYFYAVPLPRRPDEEVSWGERPALAPLEMMLEECERVAVVLFDKERARIFSVYLGSIEESREVRDEVPAKQATGGWFALAQTRYARHHEDHVLRHAKHTIQELSALLQARPFEHLLIGGPDEALAVLRAHLPRRLRARIAGTLSLGMYARDADVLEATAEAAERIERRVEQTEVEELLDAASTPHVELGLRQTLDALNDRRVSVLFIAEGFAGEGGECPACGRVTVGFGACVMCGTPTRTIGDLRERLIELAGQQGARVELVSGQAATLLAPSDWLGGWTRY
ncbi:MAG: hypothetical protein U0893_10560 [Chloroflexota bacterium]